MDTIMTNDFITLGNRMPAGDVAALNDFARFAFANPRDAAIGSRPGSMVTSPIMRGRTTRGRWTTG